MGQAVAVGAERGEVQGAVIVMVPVLMVDVELAKEYGNEPAPVAGIVEVAPIRILLVPPRMESLAFFFGIGTVGWMRAMNLEPSLVASRTENAEPHLPPSIPFLLDRVLEA